MPGTGSGWSLFGIPKLTCRARYVGDEDNGEERREATPLSLFCLCFPLFFPLQPRLCRCLVLVPSTNQQLYL